MHYSPFNMLSVVFVIAALFAATMYVGLRFRKASMSGNLQLHAQELWAPLAAEGWDRECLLYGVLQDFSPCDAGMIVRNSRDEDIGKIIFHVAARKGGITLQTKDASFEANVLPTFQQSVALHPSGDESSTLCTFKRGMDGSYCFRTNDGSGLLESISPMPVQFAPRYAYERDGKRVGVAQHIGGPLNRGQLLVLPSDIPLPIRMFILAMQAQRS